MCIMRTLAVVAVLGAIGSFSARSAPAPGEPTTLAKRFPEIARLIRHFNVRMQSEEPAVRLRVLTELTYFHPRDSRLYPPFLRYLLRDPSPKIRWEAIWRLRQHGIFLKRDELPKSYEVPLVGLCEPRNTKSLKRLRRILSGDANSAGAGWAVCALAVAKDKEVLELGKRLTNSSNVFVRFSAAVAYLELGHRERALKIIQNIAETGDDPSGFYKMSAAELMVRSGRREYLGKIIEATAQRLGEGYADAGIGVLEDLTGKYFATPSEWLAWWKRQLHTGQRNAGRPARPTGCWPNR